MNVEKQESKGKIYIISQVKWLQDLYNKIKNISPITKRNLHFIFSENSAWNALLNITFSIR